MKNVTSLSAPESRGVPTDLYDGQTLRYSREPQLTYQGPFGAIKTKFALKLPINVVAFVVGKLFIFN